jgi:phosphoribosylformylglycinamidine synthase
MQTNQPLSPAFISLRGSSALSTFRLDKLYANLKKSAPNIAHIDTEFVHFAFSETTLNENQQNTLKQILTYGTTSKDALQANVQGPSGALFLVIPYCQKLWLRIHCASRTWHCILCSNQR